MHKHNKSSTAFNVVQLPNQIEATTYICDLKKDSLEFDLLRNQYQYLRTGNAVQYLCYLFRLHGFPVNGFPWAIFTPTKEGGKTIASRLGVKTKNTIYAMLNEIRASYSFTKGYKQDPDEINFKGKLFASFHQASTHETRWYMNYPALTALAESIRNEASALKASSPVLKVVPSIALVTATQNSSPSSTPIISPTYTSINTPTDTPLLLDVCVDVGVNVEVGDSSQYQHPADTTPSSKILAGAIENSQYKIQTESNKKLLPKRSISSLYGAWKDCAEKLFNVKGLPSDPDNKSRGGIKNLREQFNKQEVNYPIEELVVAVMSNWWQLQKMLDKKHNQYWAKNSDYPLLNNIAQSFPAIFTWYSDKKEKLAQLKELADLAKEAAAKKAEYEKDNPPPPPPPPRKPINKFAKSSTGYTYIGLGFKYCPNGTVNRTYEEDYVEAVIRNDAEQSTMIMAALKKRAVDLTASLARIEQLQKEYINV